MAAKHTPGPWFTSSRSDGGIGPKSKDEDQSFGMVIPVAYIEQFDWPENFTQNANLIAAAPDLLAALTDVIGWVPGGIAFHTNAAFAAVERARAAIAKATGVQQ